MQENEIRVERMLDIGCGTGVLCHVLQEHGIKVHGMDLSEGMIEVAGEGVIRRFRLRREI